jgi:hypothetical protein
MRHFWRGPENDLEYAYCRIAERRCRLTQLSPAFRLRVSADNLELDKTSNMLGVNS